MPAAPLPIDAVLPDVVAALADGNRVVVEAPPGAGKTTRVPPALADTPWASGGRIVVLEPRRVAARAAAARMAAEAGEDVGGRVGLTTRDDRRRSARTRIEVVTEGVLVRRLQRDPSLPGIAAVVLDEFHERSLDADLALAFSLETQEALRPELRLVVMSATLDGSRVAHVLDGAPVVTASGQQFPVEVEHRDRDVLAPVAPDVAAAVDDALTDDDRGDILVFLPGGREIRQVARLLDLPADIDVRPLHGSLPPAEQDAALAPSPAGRRKVVLSTDLAESSVTVPGVTTVVDAGLAREPRLDPRTGMSRLVTVRASQASADQRAGRAGRTAPGRAIRLWSLADHAGRDPHPRPEILQADLTGLVLQVAAWGADRTELRFLDPPPDRAWEQARQLLQQLGALDDMGRITAHGRELVALPAHPRIAHALLVADRHDLRGTAVAVAAVLSERDPLRPDRDRPDADLASRVALVAGRGGTPTTARHATVERIRRERQRLLRILGWRDEPADVDRVGAVLAAAYPDRVAVRRGARGRFVLANGRGATVDPRDPLADADVVVVADVDDSGADARVWLAAAVDRDDLETVIPNQIRADDVLAWDTDRKDVVSERRIHVGAAVLAAAPVDADDSGGAVDALLDGIRQEGLDLLPWTEAARSFAARAHYLRRRRPDWPDLSPDALLDDLDDWLRPFLTGSRRRADLERVPLTDALRARLGWDRARQVDELAPTHLTVPSGSRVRLDYGAGERPVLAVKLQEMFGAAQTPTVDGEPVLVHLLSPARRPVQVTDDLDGFWDRTYPEVRSELRGRYPKHPWPEDPRSATPTRHTTRRS